MGDNRPPRRPTHGRLPRRAFLQRSALTGITIGSAGALLAACEGERSFSGDPNSPRAKTVVFDMDGGRVQSPELWSPVAPGNRDDNGMQAALMEPLFMLNYESGEIEPWLGESMQPNETLDVWTLKIRDGVKWSDGEDFDADDVVFTIMMLKDGSVELQNAVAIQEWIKDVTKVDKLTVEFTLNKPNPRFQLDYFSVKIFRCVPILPEHIWKGKDPVTFENYDPDKGWPVFTGPYKLKSTSPTKFIWERDPNWWGAKADFKPLPEPERLEWIVNETEDIRIARGTNHEIDAFQDMTTGAFESLQEGNDAIISWRSGKPYSWPDPCTRLFSLNNAAEPWDDRDMRWAINFAIDRDEVVEIAYEGSTTPARFFFPPYTPLERYIGLLEDEGLFDEYPVLRHDPAEAKRIIESKGYRRGDDGYYEKDGKQLRLQIDAPSESIEIWRYSDVIGEQLQRVGINATVRKVPFSIFFDNLTSGKFEAASDFSACGSVSEPWFSMNIYHDSWVVPIGKDANGNNIRWKNAEYSKQVTAMSDLPLGDERVDTAFVAAAREWLRDLPFLPVAHAKKLYAFDTTYWTGWPTEKNNYLQPTTIWNCNQKILHRLRPAKES